MYILNIIFFLENLGSFYTFSESLTIFVFFNAAVIDIMSHTYPEIRMKLVLRHLDTNQHLSLRTMVVAVAVTTDMVHHRPEKLMGLILVTQGDEYSRNVREQIRVFVSTY